MNIIKIAELVEGSGSYPSWTTGSSYRLETKKREKDIEVFYKIKGGRKISRIFPKEIDLTPRFCYALGFLKGEGPTSLGKSNYRRLTITNSDPKILILVLEELEKSDLYKLSQLIDKSISILHHTKPDKETIGYWSKKIRFTKKHI